MRDDVDATRRAFLRYAGTGTAALLFGLPQLGTAAPPQVGFDPDVWLELTASPGSAALRAGPATRVWSYRARVLKGDPAGVQAWPRADLGPMLRLQRGQRVRVDFLNRLDEPTIVNWHGLHVPASMMGLPRYAAAPGQRYRYEFQVRNRAGTCWYHAMSAGQTPEQVYFGLAGLLLVGDDEEHGLPLPRGEYDVPIVIQDRDWGANNQFRYPLGTGPDGVGARPPASGPDAAGGDRGGMMGSDKMSGGMGERMRQGMMGGQGNAAGGMRDMMVRLMGFFGNRIFINGRPDALMTVATRAYRLRLLNASNSRIYKLAWEDGRPLTAIAIGGGLLEQPVRKHYVMLAPGQRVELWEDFSRDAVGSQRTLVSLAFEGSMGMMGGGAMSAMRGMMDASSLPEGAPFPVLKVAVTRASGARLDLPPRLSTISRLRADDAVNCNRPRTFNITMQRMRWGFNGLSYQMDSVAPDEIVQLDTTEIWEFRNSMMMAHAIHLHGLQFQVLERSHGAEAAGVSAGRIDNGWEDTVLIMPNERVRLIMRFADFTGTYAYQCHMLEHAADGLMRNYRVDL